LIGCRSRLDGFVLFRHDAVDDNGAYEQANEGDSEPRPPHDYMQQSHSKVADIDLWVLQNVDKIDHYENDTDYPRNCRYRLCKSFSVLVI
jgi:hypothetical protein